MGKGLSSPGVFIVKLYELKMNYFAINALVQNTLKMTNVSSSKGNGSFEVKLRITLLHFRKVLDTLKELPRRKLQGDI